VNDTRKTNQDPYSSEAETRALLVPDTRTPDEKRLEQLIQAESVPELCGSDYSQALYKAALKLAGQSAPAAPVVDCHATGVCVQAGLRAEMPAPVQEPVVHQIIAGALFDFMGFLTSRNERLMLSSADNASPVVEAITNFAKMRGLSLDDARVEDWQDTTPPAAQRQWVGLTDEHVEVIAAWLEAQMIETPTTGPQLANALRYVGAQGITEKGQP